MRRNEGRNESYDGVGLAEAVEVTPPPYLIPGSNPGNVKARNCNPSTMRLEYGNPTWLFAETRRSEWARGAPHPGNGTAILRQLRRVGQAVSAFFL